MDFMRMLGKRMGWSVKEVLDSEALYDPESGEYLNEETMQAIRDVEAGKDVSRCKSVDELFALV
jgi:antitoxin component of RelBE/YafQ-DinJ toxin-antitoxin module